MKASIQIFLILIISMASCKQHLDPVVLCPPPDFPEWVEDWNWLDQKAYEDGRILFNEDSSMMMVLGPRADRDSLIHKALKNSTYNVE
jgi:hypothetical protein